MRGFEALERKSNAFKPDSLFLVWGTTYLRKNSSGPNKRAVLNKRVGGQKCHKFHARTKDHFTLRKFMVSGIFLRN